jgi:cytochrome bd-type quinol oxidase subunit 2
MKTVEQIDLNKRYQTMLVLWFALLMSVVMYFLLSLFVAPEIRNKFGEPGNSLLMVALPALGMVLVVASFAVKRELLERSVTRQDVNSVQKAMILACAMCEVAALLGLLGRFTLGNREYYLLFLLAAGGIALHFPRRRHLEAASFKSGNRPY